METVPTDILDADPPKAEQSRFDAESVRRTPFYLESQGQSLFTWLHHHVERTSFDHGVLICPPIGYEQLHSHRSLRHLSDRLAQEDVPVLRFDWHGTGDSAGTDEDVGRIAAWKANIRDAVQWMREQLGCRQISLVGLRLGGTFAALVASELEIDNLVLWSPVTKGRAYVREMKAISLTAEAAPLPALESNGDIEAAGFVLSSQTAADLNQIALFGCHPKCRRVLLVSRDDLPEDARLSEHLSASGISVENIAVPGFTEMMSEPHRSQVPETAITQIATWLSRQISLEASPTSVIDIGHVAPTDALMTLEASRSQGRGVAQIRESAVRFSTHPDLFGIVCEPSVSVERDLALIVLLNAGSSYRIGPGRLYVFLARQLAAHGYRTVRLDFCGLGDSLTPDSKRENDPHSPTALRDVDLVFRDLQQRYGVGKIVLMGLCSGAYAAFQSAAQISNPVLVESVLINPLTFFWKDGLTLDDSPVKHLVSSHYYAWAALRPEKWLKLLTGRSKTGIVGAIRMAWHRLRAVCLPKRAVRTNSNDTPPVMALGHPQREDVPGDLDRIVSRHRTLALFFATTDPGYGILRFHAGRKVKQLLRTGQLNVSFIPDADHTFSMRAARQTLSREISDYLCQRYTDRGTQ